MKFVMLLFITHLADHNEILHTSHDRLNIFEIKALQI